MKASIRVQVFLVAFLVFFLHPRSLAAAAINVDQNDSGCVTGTGQPDPYSVVYCQIQDAITDAASADDITVASGAYTQNLIINKSLTLQTTASASISPSSGAGVNLRSPSGTLSNVTISGFTIDAGSYGIMMDGNYWPEGLVIDGLTISNCTLTGNTSNAILISDGASVANLTISDCTIENNGWNVLMKGSTLTDTTFTNITFGANTGGASLSFASGNFTNVTVQNSSFTGGAWEYVDLGVGWIGTANFSNLTLRSNTFATTCQNAVWGDSTGVFEDNQVILEKNVFPSTSWVHNYTSSTVLATYNWWGSVTGPTESSNPSGQGTNIDDDAFTYTPWCTGPFAPGTPSTTSPTTDTTPSWTWTASQTCALALNSTPYTVEWCSNADFTDCSSNTSTSDTNSFTHTTALADGTWYFRVKAKDSQDNYSDYSSTASVVIDTSGPSFSHISASPASASATISWTTNEQASSQVSYGLNTNYGTTTPQTDTSPRTTSHSVALSNLAACTAYHYQLISVDSLSNQGTSADQTFTTTGCPAQASVEDETSQDIVVDSGGTVSLLDQDDHTGIGLTVPPNFASQSANFQIKKLNSSTFIQTASTPDSSTNTGATGNTNSNTLVGDHVYHLSSLADLDTPVNTFNQDLTVVISFTPSQVNNLDASTLAIYRYDGSAWHQLDTSVDSDNHLASASTNQFSTFALFGKPYNHPVLHDSGPPGPPVCNSTPPLKAPILYALSPSSSTSMSLSFYHPPEDDSIRTGFILDYGTDSDFQYSLVIKDKNASGYTVAHLNPNTKYCFKITALNQCASGPYSSSLCALTPPRSLLPSSSSDLSSSITALETIPSDTSPQSSEASASQPSQQTDLSLTVKVVDSKSQPVPKAKVEIHSQPQIAYTDQNGLALFNHLSPGQHTLYISYQNYQGQHQLNLADNNVKEYKITVEIKKKANGLLYLILGGSIIIGIIAVGFYLAYRKLKSI